MADSIRIRQACNPCDFSSDRVYFTFHISPELRQKTYAINVELAKEGRARNTAAIKAWKKAYPERARAHDLLHRAVKAGKLTRPSMCQHCGREGRIQAHHHDYSQALSVEWLCGRCHSRADQLRRSREGLFHYLD